MDTYKVYYFNMLLPAVGFPITAFVFWYDGTLGGRPGEVTAQMHPSQKAKARERSFTKGMDRMCGAPHSSCTHTGLITLRL